MTKFFFKFKKPFCLISPIFQANISLWKIQLSHTASYGFLSPCQNLAKTNNTIPRKHLDGQKDGQKDRQILFYRTFSGYRQGSNNVLYQNKIIRKVKSSICLFCKSAKKQLFIYLENVYENNIYGIKLRSSFQATLLFLKSTPNSWFYRNQHLTLFTDKSLATNLKMLFI